MIANTDILVKYSAIALYYKLKLQGYAQIILKYYVKVAWNNCTQAVLLTSKFN